MSEAIPEFIYKITTAQLWTKAQESGLVSGMPIDEADGYMHFSTAAQLAETLSLHFKGQSDLYVLRIATSDVASDLKWEPSRGGALFPHLYADLSTSAVAQAWSVNVDADGQSNLPELT